MVDQVSSFPIPDGVRIELPKRELGSVRIWGWILIAPAILGALFLIVWTSVWFGAGLGVVREGHLWGYLVMAIGLTGIWGLIKAAKFAMFGWCIWKDKTTCEVSVEGSNLLCTEKFGPFKWRRKFPVEGVNRIQIESDGTRNEQGVNLLSIRAYADQKDKSFLIAPGYTFEALEKVAIDLGEQLNQAQPGRLESRNAVEISTKVAKISTSVSKLRDHVNEEEARLAQAQTEAVETNYEQPADSKISNYDYGGSEAFHVPPMGVWKGSKGLIVFAIAWNGLMVFMSLMFFGGMFLGKGAGGFEAIAGLLVFLAFSSLFWLIGIWSLYASFNAGKRSAMLGIADGQLFVERKTLMGTKWIEVPVEEVESISVAPSGTSVNNVDIMQLQISETGGASHGLLSQLSNEDLNWLSQELNLALLDSLNNTF